MKRTLDILCSAAALIVFSPLLLLVAVILRCTGEGCVLYRQERVGKDGRIFPLYKFITMRKGSDSTPASLLSADNDPRVLPFGRLLRATKVNELPQLFNIFLGDMSLIGPRPQVKAHFDIYPDHIKQEILKVRPGLSGVGSVFFHDEGSILARSGKDVNRCYAEDIAPYKGALELWYVQHQSFSLDLRLIVLTVLVVLWPRSRCVARWLKDLPQPGLLLLSEPPPLLQDTAQTMHRGRCREAPWHGGPVSMDLCTAVVPTGTDIGLPQTSKRQAAGVRRSEQTVLIPNMRALLGHSQCFICRLSKG